MKRAKISKILHVYVQLSEYILHTTQIDSLSNKNIPTLRIIIQILEKTQQVRLPMKTPLSTM